MDKKLEKYLEENLPGYKRKNIFQRIYEFLFHPQDSNKALNSCNAENLASTDNEKALPTNDLKEIEDSSANEVLRECAPRRKNYTSNEISYSSVNEAHALKEIRASSKKEAHVSKEFGFSSSENKQIKSFDESYREKDEELSSTLDEVYGKVLKTNTNPSSNLQNPIKPQDILKKQEALLRKQDEINTERKQNNNVSVVEDFSKSLNISNYIKQENVFSNFQTLLFKYIDDKGLKDSEVYNKVHIDRRLFSKIRSDNDYHPSFETVLLLAFALELSEKEMDELLFSASYSLPKNCTYNLVIRYCFLNKIYDLMTVNSMLYSKECKIFKY